MTEAIEEYAHDCRIVREEGNGYEQYHYEGPLGRVKSFENPRKARLYADVQTVMGGFREEKTGERGVPPSVEWVARHFDLPEERVREYIGSLRDRAEKQRNATAENGE